MLSERASEIKENLEKIKSDIYEAASGCGRNPEEIRLMAVSKTKPLEDIKAAYDAGQRLFGENRINEAAEKFSMMPDDTEMHMIGHLQSNKAKIAAESAVCVQSIDKLSTARELDKRASACGRAIDILIEINTSGEFSKSGYEDYDSFLKDLEGYLTLENVRLRGLMTIAPFVDDEKQIRNSFSALYRSFCRLKDEKINADIDTLSMGMSSDFRIAIEEGSTVVRVGTAIFGRRNY